MVSLCVSKTLGNWGTILFLCPFVWYPGSPADGSALRVPHAQELHSGENALHIVPDLERNCCSFKALPELSLMLRVRTNDYTSPTCAPTAPLGFSWHSFQFVLWVVVGGVETLTKEAPSRQDL